jgi:hypothetical protein
MRNARDFQQAGELPDNDRERHVWWDGGVWASVLAFVPHPCDQCGKLIPGGVEFEERLPPMMRPSGEYAPERRCAACRDAAEAQVGERR